MIDADGVRLSARFPQKNLPLFQIERLQTMWIDLLIQLIFLCVIVYIPGYLMTRALGIGGARAICFAPLLSLAGYYITAMVLVNLSIASSWLGIVVPFCLASLLLFLLRTKRSADADLCVLSFDCKTLCLYVAMGSVLTFFVYVMSLDSAASFLQQYDNYSHVSQIRTFLDSGYFAEPSLMSYPSLWHCLGALAADFWGGYVTVAANAVNIFILALVFPVSLFGLFRALFGSDKTQLRISALLVGVFTAFPWGFVSFGPLYPLLLGNALLLAVISVLVEYALSSSLCEFFRGVVLFVVGCVVLAVSHPSSIFAGIVLAFPFLCSCIYRRCSCGNGRKHIAMLFVAVFLAGLGLLWLACYMSAAFSSVVSFNWPSFASKAETLVRIGSFYLLRYGAPQLMVAVVVFIGVGASLYSRRYRWTLVSLLATMVMYFSTVATEGTIKHVLTGFWYTDSFRIAALVAIAAMPIASIGLNAIWKFACKVSTVVRSGITLDQRGIAYMGAGLSLIFLCGVFLPSFTVPSDINVVTAFGALSGSVRAENSLKVNDRAFDLEEIKFANKVKEITGDAKVQNYPYDGSLYAYALCGLNVTERQWGGYLGDVDADRHVVRTELNECGSNVDVRNALLNEDIEYVMILDIDRMRNYATESGSTDGFYYADYLDGSWSGLESMEDGLPGFETVLSDGDMRLYRVVR